MFSAKNVNTFAIFQYRNFVMFWTTGPWLLSSVVSSDSDRGQWRPWSDCMDAQADLGLGSDYAWTDFHTAKPLRFYGEIRKIQKHLTYRYVFTLLRYLIYHKHLDTLTPHHTFPKFCKFICCHSDQSKMVWQNGKQCKPWSDCSTKSTFAQACLSNAVFTTLKAFIYINFKGVQLSYIL